MKTIKFQSGLTIVQDPNDPTKYMPFTSDGKPFSFTDHLIKLYDEGKLKDKK